MAGTDKLLAGTSVYLAVLFAGAGVASSRIAGATGSATVAAVLELALELVEQPDLLLVRNAHVLVHDMHRPPR
eukprot:COSAG01_NODE_16198_length_1260_cov_51.586563_1_plen_73_part_00